MREVVFVVFFLLSPSLVVGEPQSNGGYTEKLVGALLMQGVTLERIIGLDRNGVPRVCGTGLTETGHRAESVALSPGDLPLGTRNWECVPGVIRYDGVESFRLEVNVNGPVNTVVLDTISNPINLSIVSLLHKWVMGRSNDPESYPLPGGSSFIVSLGQRLLFIVGRGTGPFTE